MKTLAITEIQMQLGKKKKSPYLAVCHRVRITDFKEFHRFFFFTCCLSYFSIALIKTMTKRNARGGGNSSYFNDISLS